MLALLENQNLHMRGEVKDSDLVYCIGLLHWFIALNCKLIEL